MAMLKAIYRDQAARCDRFHWANKARRLVSMEIRETEAIWKFRLSRKQTRSRLRLHLLRG